MHRDRQISGNQIPERHWPGVAVIANILISGASGGLGRALALECAERGNHVHAGYYANKPKFETLPKGSITPVHLNVRDLESVATACSDSAKAAPIDILVNNAGIHLGGYLKDLDQDDFKHVLDVNLLGVWRLTNAALPHMPDGSIIVMVSSLSGLVGLPRDGAYAASKFALEGMSQSLAAELAPRSIRVVVIEPGAIATGFAGNRDGETPQHMAEHIANIVEAPGSALRFPLGEMGKIVSDQLDLDRGNRTEALVKKVTGSGWHKQ